MHLFGTLGTLMFIIGFMLAAILGIDKLIYVHKGMAARLITDSPYFYIALATMILGTQLFLAGFLGELISGVLHTGMNTWLKKHYNKSL